MKPAGFLCNIDNLGRIVIPAPVRKTYDLNKGDAVEIFTDENGIMMKKYNPSCIFCGGVENISSYKGKNICESCIKKLSNLVEE
ncbi:MAG: AbrB/MazE/SpoVT family DNA-binding domain-containing protein [Acutalibacteraceae bacterium]